MRVKAGVLFERNGFEVQPMILDAWSKIAREMESTGEFTVTSLLDSHEHKPRSLHNFGLACDLRDNHLLRDKQIEVAAKIKSILGLDYDVACETKPDHIHFEASDKWLAENGDPRNVA